MKKSEKKILIVGGLSLVATIGVFALRRWTKVCKHVIEEDEFRLFTRIRKKEEDQHGVEYLSSL